MKVLIEEDLSPRGTKMGDLVISKVGRDVVLVTEYDSEDSEFSGVCLTTLEYNKTGYYTTKWATSAFTPFYGKVTLQN